MSENRIVSINRILDEKAEEILQFPIEGERERERGWRKKGRTKLAQESVEVSLSEVHWRAPSPCTITLYLNRHLDSRLHAANRPSGSDVPTYRGSC